jgi:hypothetical protein
MLQGKRLPHLRRNVGSILCSHAVELRCRRRGFLTHNLFCLLGNSFVMENFVGH